MKLCDDQKLKLLGKVTKRNKERMERSFAIPRQTLPFTRARSYASTVNTPYEYASPSDPPFVDQE